MNRKKITYGFITLIIVMCLCGVVGAQGITLEQTIQAALENNEKIKQYNEKLEQAKYADREAKGNFLPSVTLQASYNHLNDPLAIDLSPIRDAMIRMQASNQVEYANIYTILQGNPALTQEQRSALYSQYSAGLNDLLPQFRKTLKDQDYGSATLVAIQPLFMGGKLLAAKKYASAEKHSAEYELNNIKNEIIRDAVKSYLSIVLLQQAVKTREDVFEGMKHHQQNAKRLSEEGLIARYDLLRADVAVADADRNLFDERNRLELAKVAFRNIVGWDEDAPVVVADTFRYFSVSDSLKVFLDQAYSEQPILQMISQKKISASQKYSVERSKFLPQVVGFGKYELYDKDLSALEPKWVVGVQVSMSLFNGFKDYNTLNSAKSLKREVEYLEIGVKRKINLWVNKSYRDMRNAETRYQKLETSVALAQESVNMNEKRFQTGLGTSLEVIDSRLSLEKNLIERVTSLYDYYNSLTELLSAAGHPADVLTIWYGEESK